LARIPIQHLAAAPDPRDRAVSQYTEIQRESALSADDSSGPVNQR
jgi:hypothetical protein